MLLRFQFRMHRFFLNSRMTGNFQQFCFVSRNAPVMVYYCEYQKCEEQSFVYGPRDKAEIYKSYNIVINI